MATTTIQRRTFGDPALAARLRSGDPAAFEDLYRNHHQHVTRYVTARLARHDRDAVDDLVQDTFCAAIADPAGFDDDVFGCLRRLAARACTRHLSAARYHTRTVYAIDDDHLAASGDQPAAPTDWAMPAGRIETGRIEISQALARLAPDQRHVIELLYLDGHSRPQVAATIGRSVNTVRTLQRRALHHLKQQLAGADSSHPA